MSFHRRYHAIELEDPQEIVYIDVLGTIDRQLAFRDNGRFHWGAANCNVRLLDFAYQNRWDLLDVQYWDPTTDTQQVNPSVWLRRHGVRVTRNVWWSQMLNREFLVADEIAHDPHFDQWEPHEAVNVIDLTNHDDDDDEDGIEFMFVTQADGTVTDYATDGHPHAGQA